MLKAFVHTCYVLFYSIPTPGRVAVKSSGGYKGPLRVQCAESIKRDIEPSMHVYTSTYAALRGIRTAPNLFVGSNALKH